MAKLINGKELAKKIREDIATKVTTLKAEGINPCLVVVRVGEDPASAVYVRNKKKACEKAGIKSIEHHLAENTTEEKLISLVKELNDDKSVHGILVQLPLPKHINGEKIIDLINPIKDVDGFHPYNQGKLLTGRSGPRPCTPYGIMIILESINYDLKGKNAVVVGRSNIVGKPIALMLMEKHATITICHSRTKDLDKVVSNADLVIAAIGKPDFIKGSWIKKGAVVIDVGINRLDDGSLVGDVEFDEAQKRASHITPVPGGVGPMTIAMLLKNTVEAASLSIFRHTD
ncbi:bifunctional methylenetetrahydrofolate dehydrogenase/methenyltetrahydrofolate cyclohydrolase FolD [bacterium]|nr:bifunctional methylenetetrahydrofolate dehydrogenase/methenyltetrahydrofolate cyclohydrolase FolD [bacterium]